MATRKKAAKKAPAKKVAAKKTAAKKATPRKAPAKKAAARKAPARASTGPSARERGVTVESYVAGLPDWRGETVSALRRLIREAAPDAVESIKWAQPVYEANGPFAYIKAYKSHVNFGFWRGADLTDPKGTLQGGGSRMRHVELRNPADIDTASLQTLVRAAVELNRAKGDPTKRR
jgi:hypothetical protein